MSVRYHKSFEAFLLVQGKFQQLPTSTSYLPFFTTHGLSPLPKYFHFHTSIQQFHSLRAKIPQRGREHPIRHQDQRSRWHRRYRRQPQARPPSSNHSWARTGEPMPTLSEMLCLWGMENSPW